MRLWVSFGNNKKYDDEMADVAVATDNILLVQTNKYMYITITREVHGEYVLGVRK